MIKPEEANGFLAVVYEMMERMTTKDRLWFLKAIKMARREMNVIYPLGKPDEPKKVDLIVPGGSDGIIKA